MNRAYSLIEVKSLDEKRRVFSGWATTPEMDRVGDTIDPMGAKFTNPVTLLHHHDSRAPIGHVTFSKPTAKGIEFEAEIPNIEEAGSLRDRVDTAWGEIKAGLVRAVSIGFKPLKHAFIKETGGIDFQQIEIFELSTVSVPANAGALITQIKSIDRELRQRAGVPEPEPLLPAASGTRANVVVRLTPPASGKSQTSKTPMEGTMKISEKVRRFEEKRAANMARMAAIHEESDESLNDNQLDEIKTLEAEVDTIDRDLPSLRRAERALAESATPVRTIGDNGGPPLVASVSVKAPPVLAPGIAYARLVKVKMAARLSGDSPLVMARQMYGDNSEVVGILQKAAVPAGTTVPPNWASTLISPEGAAVAAFLEYLRPQSILGKFGTNGYPSLQTIDFFAPVVTQTGGGAAYWVGEGKPKPLTSFTFARTTLTPLKIANIAVLTEENIRYSSPNSDEIVRRELARAIVQGLDVAFIDPANAGVANVKPASITNGAPTIASTGDDADAIRLDVRALLNIFVKAHNPPAQGVWIMSATNALALALQTNALGQQEFPTVNMFGGSFYGMPVITSENVGDNVVLLSAEQVFVGDEGGIAVDMSRETSLEMSDAPTNDAGTGTGAALVSMFQTNSVALRAERTINWKRARATAVAYLSSVSWGGIVPEPVAMDAREGNAQLESGPREGETQADFDARQDRERAMARRRGEDDER